MHPINRAGPGHVALETTLLAHGVPKGHGLPLARELADIITRAGAQPAIIGLHRGHPTVGLSWDELSEMLAAPKIAKANSANLGVLIHRRAHAATTVSTTMELAAAAGIRLFATGGLGGVHRNYAARLDISSDLAALARFPVAVVCSGVKSLLDVASTREALETLGVPVVGFRTDTFPAFYLRESEAGLDARFDDPADLSDFIHAELARSGRGIVVANPVPESDQIEPSQWNQWLAKAQARTTATGRDVTPAILAALHEVSSGATLRTNLALVRSNAELAARLCRA
jgi:pseudouridylate synthase